MGDQLAASQASAPGVFFLYEGGVVPEELRRKLTLVRVAPHVEEIPPGAFSDCGKLEHVQFNKRLQVIGEDRHRAGQGGIQ